VTTFLSDTKETTRAEVTEVKPRILKDCSSYRAIKYAYFKFIRLFHYSTRSSCGFSLFN
jgi:hypothetical protein